MSTLYIVRVGDMVRVFTQELLAKSSYQGYVDARPKDKIELLRYDEPSDVVARHFPEEVSLKRVVRCCGCGKYIEYGSPLFLMKVNNTSLGYAEQTSFCSRECAENHVTHIDAGELIYDYLASWADKEIRENEICS